MRMCGAKCDQPIHDDLVGGNNGATVAKSELLTLSAAVREQQRVRVALRQRI